MHLHPCPGRGGSAGFVTSCELRESVATYVLLRSGEHERVNERNPSKASTKAPAFIYSGVILLYQLQKMRSYVYPRVGVRECVRAPLLFVRVQYILCPKNVRRKSNNISV